MAEVKWIKIVTDIFDDEKVLLIENMPEADSIIVIWFKLLCMAGKQNNNGVFMMNDKIPYTDEMLATIFRRPLNTVRLALSIFEKYGMIEIVNNVYTITNWEKHQSLDALQKQKEQNRLRVAAYRDRKRAELQECNANSNVTVTECNGVDKDIEEERERDKDTKKENIKRKSDFSFALEVEEIISYLNEKCCSNYKTNNKATVRHIRARLSEGYTIDDFKKVINKKYNSWNGTDMAKYLRPETLFGTKFESYLNEQESAVDKEKAELKRIASAYDHLG